MRKKALVACAHCRDRTRVGNERKASWHDRAAVRDVPRGGRGHAGAERLGLPRPRHPQRGRRLHALPARRAALGPIRSAAERASLSYSPRATSGPGWPGAMPAAPRTRLARRGSPSEPWRSLLRAPRLVLCRSCCLPGSASLYFSATVVFSGTHQKVRGPCLSRRPRLARLPVLRACQPTGYAARVDSRSWSRRPLADAAPPVRARRSDRARRTTARRASPRGAAAVGARRAIFFATGRPRSVVGGCSVSWRRIGIVSVFYARPVTHIYLCADHL